MNGSFACGSKDVRFCPAGGESGHVSGQTPDLEPTAYLGQCMEDMRRADAKT
jgi:hypothetical protein